jgi:large subunit ribosomal protein L24
LREEKYAINNMRLKMALHIKKGDIVEIIAGDHKGATGRVLRVIPEKQRVVVQGHNISKKHVRPSRRNPQGGRINVEQPIHISNVLPVNPKSSRASRVRYQLNEDGSKKRIAADGTEIGVVRKAK